MKKLVLSQILITVIYLGSFFFFYFILVQDKYLQSNAETLTYYEKIAIHYIQVGLAVIITVVILTGLLAFLNSEIGLIFAGGAGSFCYILLSLMVLAPTWSQEPRTLPIVSGIAAVIPILVAVSLAVYAATRQDHNASTKSMSIVLPFQAVIIAGIMLFVLFH